MKRTMRMIPIPVFFFLLATGFGSGLPEEGKDLYEQHCARCHGADGAGGFRKPAI